jgi:hypothetical protein
MLKLLTLFTTLLVFGAGSASAQQREALLQKVEVPNAGFYLLVAVTKPGSPAVNFRSQPDPNVIYLGNELVTAYTAELAEMLDIPALMHPVETTVLGQGEPVVIYIIPKSPGTNSRATQ